MLSEEIKKRVIERAFKDLEEEGVLGYQNRGFETTTKEEDLKKIEEIFDEHNYDVDVDNGRIHFSHYSDEEDAVDFVEDIWRNEQTCNILLPENVIE